jgi:superfamily II DNA or RNA helicase/HKD family nuclease
VRPPERLDRPRTRANASARASRPATPGPDERELQSRTWYPRPVSDLPPGLYEQVVTEALAKLLGDGAHLRELDPGAAPRVLARLVQDAVVRVLGGVKGEDALARQVELTNALLETLHRDAPTAVILPDDAVAAPARELTAVLRAAPGLARARVPERPRLPLRASDLLVNGPRDLRIGSEIPRELASADRVDVLVSFLKWSGLRLVLEPLRRLVERGGKLRVLTTAYLGATEPRALDALQALGGELRVSYDTRRTRLHAKAWLFHRDSGFSTALVGSSNLSAAALLDGLEWNVRLSVVDNRAVLEKFATTFEQYWGEGEFLPYDPEAFRQATRRNRSDGSALLPIAVHPHAHQREILDALAYERSRGHRRNLVVSATGTGKTVVAALDYQALVREHGPLRLLFVAHRREILEKARLTYRTVLTDGSFGDLLIGETVPLDDRHVFASVQSLGVERLARLDPTWFDVVVVDETHHAAETAVMYDRLLDHVRPRFLLGLTATPERADGQSILPRFDGRIAAELRLWGALERGLLAPFQYFGVHDNVDLADLRWTRSGYRVEDLERLYDGNDARAALVLAQLREKVRDPLAVRALGFCVSVAHAEFMARRFRDAGLPSVALHGRSRTEDRARAIRQLEAGELRAIFSADLFNEGVDIPSVDTVLFLRPTQSPTVFLQQLGRGLRLCEGKECLTVLDFIGNARREYRFDRLYRAILPGTSRQVAVAIEEGFPTLPAGCAMQLDRQSYEIVLGNVRRALQGGFRGLTDDLRELGDVPLAAFVERAEVDLDELYRAGRGFTDLRRAAGFERREAGPLEGTFQRAFARLLHVDDEDRLLAWQTWLAEPSPPPAATDPWEAALQRQLFIGLGAYDRDLDELEGVLGELWAHAPQLEELRQLLGVLADRLRQATYGLAGCPLRVHARYSLDEIMAAYDVRQKQRNRIYRPRGQGVYFHEPSATDLLFVTLEKTESEYSPTTMYEDYPLSPTEFHWESQNGTAPHTPVGRRYLDPESRVLLFARERRKDARGETLPYTFLGRARCERAEGERPMRIVWRLDRPMAGGWFEQMKVAAG